MVLGITDVVLLLLSVLASASIGVYYGIKGRKSTPLEYMLGGRSMSPLPLAVSMTVGTVSAITIMGNAGEMYAYGTQLWVMDLGILLGMIVIARVLIPIIYPLQAVSLYQYIDERFKSRWLRKATVALMLVTGYSFIGFLLFPPSLALMYLTGMPISSNIAIIGLTCTLYSSFGGVKAVVYADMVQSVVMVSGVLAIVIQGSFTVGGLDKVWDIAYHNDRIEFFNWSLDPYQRHSFWLCLIWGFFFTVGTYGVNQCQTQRFFSTGSVQQAQWVLYYAAGGMLLLRGLIHLSGLVIYANLKDCDPLTKNPARLGDPTEVVIPYVLANLTRIPGLTGLFVAAVYAAVLSSVSTQLNSLTALLWEDFLKELPIFRDWSEVKQGRLQKAIVLATGCLGVGSGLLVMQLGMSFLRALFAITGAFNGPLIGLFLIALYLPWVNVKGASVGFVVSIVFSLVLAVGQLSQGREAYLPLSRLCPHTAAPPQPINATITTLASTIIINLPNTTDIITSTEAIEESVSSTQPVDVTTSTFQPQPHQSNGGFFGVSYCLNSLWGTLLCLLCALLVTTCTGPNTPEDVKEHLISPTSWVLFQRPLQAQVKELFSLKHLHRQHHPSSVTKEYKEEKKPVAKSLEDVTEPLNNSSEQKIGSDVV